jgi:hypothetical protein
MHVLCESGATTTATNPTCALDVRYSIDNSFSYQSTPRGLSDFP